MQDKIAAIPMLPLSSSTRSMKYPRNMISSQITSLSIHSRTAHGRAYRAGNTFGLEGAEAVPSKSNQVESYQCTQRWQNVSGPRHSQSNGCERSLLPEDHDKNQRHSKHAIDSSPDDHVAHQPSERLRVDPISAPAKAGHGRRPTPTNREESKAHRPNCG